MDFEFGLLHNPTEDNTNRKLLRVYSVIPRFSNNRGSSKDEQAILVTTFLKKVNNRLREEISPDWKNKWLQLLGCNFSKSSHKDWFIGRASLPLIALEKLAFFGLEIEINQLKQRINYVSSTTGDITLVPKKLTPDLLYLCGIILGDGSLPVTRKFSSGNFEYKIFIFSGDKKNLETCRSIFSKLFSKKPRIYFRINKAGSCWVLEVKSKTIYRFFINIMKMPYGDKGSTGHIPSTIKSLPQPMISAFLAGMVDSDIGKHGKGMGATFKSKTLVLDLIEELEKVGVQAKSYGAYCKDGKYIQHDFSIPKAQMKKFKEVLEKHYLPKRKDRLKTLFSLAGVP